MVHHSEAGLIKTTEELEAEQHLPADRLADAKAATIGGHGATALYQVCNG